MFVIAGVTGNTGAVVADALLTARAPVRVIVREPAKGEPWRAKGAEVAVAALEDTAALARALAGARGAYLLVPPRPTSRAPLAENRALVASLAAAVGKAQVPHVVLLSSIAAQHAEGTGPIVSAHDAEVALAPVTALTAVRAAYFIENWFASLGGVADGVLPTFIGAMTRLPMVATRDIGRTAAAALLEGPRGRDVIELTSVDATPAEVAAEVAALTGKAIAPAEGPLDAVIPAFTSFGLSAEVAALYREMYAAIPAGRIAWEGGAARAVRGTTTLADVLRPALAR